MSSKEEVKRAVSTLESAIDHISTWMRTNRLKLKDGKTEFVVLGTNRNREKAGIDAIRVGDSTIPCSLSTRNLGVFLDYVLNLERHNY